MPSNPPEKTKREDEARAPEKNRETDEERVVQSSREKIPEGPGNLRRRADWFQKRTGQTP